MRSISCEVGAVDLDADRRAHAVVSMSMRFLIGIVQALETPGICSASSISATS